jgi:hypothetical protein
MKLRPDYLDEDSTSVEAEVIDEKLVSESIAKAFSTPGFKPKKSGKVDMDEVRKIFDENGCSIEEVAKMTGAVIRSADDDSLRIRAGELALKVHQVFKDMDSQVPVINIQIAGDGNVVNLLCPK